MKKKNTILKVIVAVLTVLLAGSVMFTVVQTTRDEGADLSFVRGGLTEDGEYKETIKSIYTKDAFEVDELTIKCEFDANLKYQVFYYDDMDKFISSTDEFTSSEKIVTPEGATHARIMITPIWNVDTATEDQYVHWYQVQILANELNIDIEVVKETAEAADAAA